MMSTQVATQPTDSSSLALWPPHAAHRDQPEAIHISVLGVVGATVGDRELVVHGSQPRIVLAILVLHRGQPVTADELAAALWPRARSEHWEGAVRGVISKVRSFLHELGASAPMVDNLGHTYRLVCDEHVHIDLWKGESELELARAHLLAGRSDAAAAAASNSVELLAEALLPELDDVWLGTWRRQIATLRHRGLRLASVAHTGSGNHDEATRLATSAIADDPYDEESHRLLMAALLAAGNCAAALQAYSHCRRILADELGVSPSAETEALYLRLLAPEPVGITQRATPTQRLLPLLTDRPFVGREREVALLLGAWERARNGARQIVFVHGEAGVGKTRTGLEAVRRMAPANILYGRCSAERIVPFEPFVEAIGRFAERLDDDELSRLIEGFAPEIASLVPAIGRRIAPVDRGTAAQRRVRSRPTLFAAVSTVLARMAVRPTVLALDDLHWADPSTLLLFRHVAPMLEQSSVLIVVTYRDDAPTTPSLATAVTALHRLENCQSIHLGGLTTHDVADLLRLAAIPNADEVGEALHRRTGGNSFYLTQVLSAAAERADVVDPGHVPDTVSELVRLRVGTLSDAAQHVLAIAAAIGTGVPRCYLEPTMSLEGASGVALDELVDRRLLLEDDRGDFGFTHAIVRDAVYAQLPPSRRRRIHNSIAAALATVEHHDAGTHDVRASVATIAHHLEHADRKPG
jgi:DNA-binding SARP family transcriptional activator